LWIWQTGNLKGRKITQHAYYLILLHGCLHIDPNTKSHVGKEDKNQFIHGRLTLVLSSAATTFHATANVTSRKCDSGNECSIFFWNIFIIVIHGLVYFHENTKEVFKEFSKTKNAKTLKQHQRFFLDCIVVIIVDYVNVKVISITCIGFIW
jgi:hypothetical protein